MKNIKYFLTGLTVILISCLLFIIFIFGSMLLFSMSETLMSVFAFFLISVVVLGLILKAYHIGKDMWVSHE